MSYPNFVQFRITLGSPLHDKLSYEQVREWAEAGIPEWANWTEQMVIEYNVKCQLAHDAGKRFVYLNTDVCFGTVVEEALYTTGWTPVPRAPGVTTSWRSPLVKPTDLCTEVVDRAVEVLKLLRGLTYEEVVGK